MRALHYAAPQVQRQKGRTPRLGSGDGSCDPSLYESENRHSLRDGRLAIESIHRCAVFVRSVASDICIARLSPPGFDLAGGRLSGPVVPVVEGVDRRATTLTIRAFFA
jgi:hypothetical protein